MGTHPNGPATIVHEKQLLSEYISANPDSLGDKIREKFGDQLPFLFKAGISLEMRYFFDLIYHSILTPDFNPTV